MQKTIEIWARLRGIDRFGTLPARAKQGIHPVDELPVITNPNLLAHYVDLFGSYFQNIRFPESVDGWPLAVRHRSWSSRPTLLPRFTLYK